MYCKEAEIWIEPPSQERDEGSVSELFERLVEVLSPVEMLRRLRSVVEFENKNKLLSNLAAYRAERTP